MRAVWSHWTKPLRGAPGTAWLDIRHYLMAFVVSCATAKQHFAETVLVTDSPGARMLVDDVGLDFDHVIVDLDQLSSECLFWWNLGKIHAYRIQTEAFIHLDNDVFLWGRLPERLLTAPVFAQNPEYFTEQSNYYLPLEMEAAIIGSGRGWLPPEWRWGRDIYGSFQKSMNTGIYGGNHVDFIQYAANLHLELLHHPSNLTILQDLPEKARVTGMLEMCLPSLCADFHAGREGSPFHDIDVEYLFQSAEAAYAEAEAMGYTHLLGGAKRQPSTVAKLERRVQRDFPDQYERCCRISDDNPNYLGGGVV